jgi:uncharacterized protein (DUF2267 family)
VETGVRALDSSLQKSELWLKEVMERMGWSERDKAYAGLRAVLHALRDRLLADEAFDFAAELPLVLRGMYFEDWKRGRPTRERSREDFLARVSERLVPGRDVDPERLTRAVFDVVGRHVSSGEIRQILAQLPAPVRELWTLRPKPAGKRSPEVGRAALRRAKRRIAEVLALARAEGADPDDLPLMVTRRELRRKPRRA